MPFKVKEKKTHFVESWRNLWKKPKKKFQAISNIIVLFFSAISNWFGSSYILGGLFTLVFGGLFYYLSIINTDLYDFSWKIDWVLFEKNLGAFAQFMIPTHRFDYATIYFTSENIKYFPSFYLLDFIGRIFVGYGIYQTIYAFRKYK